MQNGGSDPLAIMETLGDFTSKENWDNFFSLRGTGDSFEWYADWPELKGPLLSHLSAPSDSVSSMDLVEILVPGCGSSRLSEFIYDAGFRCITNVDFSKVVISDMLRRYVRSRPEMKWRIMDMTNLQFSDEVFDIVLDKGGLDALMEPEVGTALGSKYIKEVKRVLKNGGKFICLTLAESHVLGLLLPEFRFGWEMTIQAIPNKPSCKSNFETFMVVIVKGKFATPTPIKSLFDDTALSFSTKQVNAVVNAVEKENSIRIHYSSGEDLLFSLKDLQLGAKGELKELIPGQRFQLILGEEGNSLYCYKAVLLDAKAQSEPFTYHCAVFIVPKIRAHEWLFSSEEGQWMVVENSKAARLIMVFLDSRHMHASMKLIQSDLSPLVVHLAPDKVEDESLIPYMMADDGVKQRNIVQKAVSKITGPIIVEDVVYESPDEENNSSSTTEGPVYRRLVFERSAGLVQSEAFLTREGKTEQDKKVLPSVSKKKKGTKKNNLCRASDSTSDFRIDHTRLASSYHTGILSGFSLIASSLKTAVEAGEKVKVVIVGLGAGLLPMFLHECLPFLQIEVIELDPVVVDLAKKHFGFIEDQQMKVHIGDGVKYVFESTERENDNSKETRILVIDADSSDLSSGLTCPHPNFVEEVFLKSAKEFLSQGGLFVTNLVSRSAAVRETVISHMKEVFDHLFSLQLEEEVNEVLFACTNKTKIETEKSIDLEKLMKFRVEGIEASVSTRIQRLK
ncbi:methyltransferase-like protein 13 isoform X1 [Carex littledalei]|uniref:Methyltransferase-like protein 13 isoform X1 n=1 Tax=Carex littledalei TaxID=544730 RepID=A0A833QG55_9POAL|nr:methyltransferase-like protein 13 isoform X1 [Carex littledalei]